MTIEELKNRLRLPVIAAPMFLVSGTELVLAACTSGILGAFPSLNGRTSRDFERMLQEVTTGLEAFQQQSGSLPAPYAVNLIVNKTNARLMPDLELCIRYRVPVVITSLGAVREIVDAVHSYGGLVFHDVIKRRHAEKAAEAGVDGIICVSAGAGGHAGTLHPFPLLEEIRSVYDGALILSGCINAGREVLAAQVLGADFAYMGTRFIPAVESMAPDAYREMLLRSRAEDIVYTPAVSGVHASFLKESLQHAGIDPDTPTREGLSGLSEEAKAWKDVWSAGQGVSGIHSIGNVPDIVRDLEQEYRQALERISKLR